MGVRIMCTKGAKCLPTCGWVFQWANIRKNLSVLVI